MVPHDDPRYHTPTRLRLDPCDRAALQKGGQDANMVNTRLGAALALAGQRAEAEAAFRAVTGQRAELAQLWLLWLSSHQTH